jgi:hypothetical protein
MALAVRSDDDKREKERAQHSAWGHLFGGGSAGFYNGTNSGSASGTPVTAVVTASGTFSKSWDAQVTTGHVFYTGCVVENTATLALSNGAVIVAGAGNVGDIADYSPETAALLDRLIATPLDTRAPAGEQEFLDWLNGN